MLFAGIETKEVACLGAHNNENSKRYHVRFTPFFAQCQPSVEVGMKTIAVFDRVWLARVLFLWKLLKRAPV